MPTPLPDYYAIMNLKPSATQAEVKQRYRELARRFHPDVNPSPDSAQKIKTVNEAHRVLGDPERRSQYDAERILNPMQQTRTGRSTEDSPRSAADRQRQPDRPFSRNSPPPPKPPPTRQQRSGPRVEFNGFGRVTPENAQQKRTASSAQ